MTDEVLNKLKARDVVRMPMFLKEMERQVAIEQQTQTEAIKRGLLKRTPLDRLRERGVFNGEKMVELYEAVMDRSLIGFSAAEREYINRIGLLVFGRVLSKLRNEE